ncbi:lamin tail domain-containing protein [Aggregatimonas sangjinii]|uniref:Lamin tail domain-containing protein n=1 Tax=Aggregatimonas sangjinii TaxID=2583587 RepID=A0A5B7SY96_9FLAO|nr:DUF5689 domain-containing protein [Aggregatimonas sangjinii]QCX02133.1 lamin tail domain-containing protein [Aggregatimonas sangjinii]
MVTKASICQKAPSVLFGLFLLFACVKDKNFDLPTKSCSTDLIANTTYAEVKALYQDETFQIQDDLIIEGYVVSSDEAGNFFSVLYFQDSPVDPKEGFQIELDVRDSHLFYPIGSKIIINLKGLYLGRSKGVFKIGGVFTSFGNVSVGRLPAAIVDNHIFVSCEEVTDMVPTSINITDVEENLTNTLVRLNDVEILEEQLSESFAVPKEETERTLTNCNDNELILVNSGFSDFQAELLPQENGSITGVLLRENDNYFLAIRDLADIEFDNERCADLVDEFTATTIFISELADPDNNSGARFVELYNSDEQALSLKGWMLRRYTNDNTEVSSTIDLSAFVIAPQSTLVVSPNEAEFESVYGFAPDLGVGTNSPADSNGDDNLELIDPFGTVIDTFGIVGEDGTGTDHEFEDGRALRRVEITEGNPIYTSSEWIVFNDSGDSGTVNQPQIAPEDFSPGLRD